LTWHPVIPDEIEEVAIARRFRNTSEDSSKVFRKRAKSGPCFCLEADQAHFLTYHCPAPGACNVICQADFTCGQKEKTPGRFAAQTGGCFAAVLPLAVGRHVSNPGRPGGRWIPRKGEFDFGSSSLLRTRIQPLDDFPLRPAHATLRQLHLFGKPPSLFEPPPRDLNFLLFSGSLAFNQGRQ